jgi:dTDP-4-dehydrorhamnose reductase
MSINSFGKSKTRVLVLGSTGMIGHMIYSYLCIESTLEVFDTSRRKLTDKTYVCDLLNFDSLIKILKDLKPSWIINASGILIEESEKDPQRSKLINGILPKKLAEYCKNLDTRIIQLSTDCVFSGENSPYTEKSKKNSKLIYGKTKSMGELNDNKNVTLRTSTIGPDLFNDGTELFHWFFLNESVKGYTKSIWNGITTLELAKRVRIFMQSECFGLYHISNHYPISKYELLKLINKIFGARKDIDPVDGVITSKVLQTNLPKIYKDINYENQFEELLLFMKNDSEFKKHYERQYF